MKGGSTPRPPGDTPAPGAELHMLHGAGEADKIAEQTRKAKDLLAKVDWDLELSLASYFAKVSMTRFNAYKTAGFNPDEALKMTMSHNMSWTK